jgi:hypothetical protein
MLATLMQPHRWRSGGVVDPILPLLRALEIKRGWHLIHGEPRFFAVAKQIHNALEGADYELTDVTRRTYRQFGGHSFLSKPPRLRQFPLLLGVVEKRHETVVHVQLLVAVEESEARIISDKVNVVLLVATQHDHVFYDSGCCCSREISKLKAVAMKMNGMNIIASVAHANAIPLALLQVE